MSETNERKLSEASMLAIRKMQQNEINECMVYAAIARRTKDGENKRILERLSAEEKKHAQIWEKYTGVKLKPQRFKVAIKNLTAIVLGFTFVIKKMESGEENAQVEYEKLSDEVPESKIIMADEEAHEQILMKMLDEERLRYVGSMVLGLNDALVELTGTLAGLTIALKNTKLIALSGLITGISATLSMASSEFLSAKSDGRNDALKSCAYTGVAYVITVALLILPYLILPNEAYMAALVIMLVTVVVIIAVFNYYISIAKDLKFRQRFAEMAVISLGVAALSFCIGLVVKNVLGIDV
ncbi:MAG: VIT1/CCC1 transporter family protein [Oscillospiraceae bacterium]